QTVADVPILRTGKGFQGAGCPEEGCEFTEEQLDLVVSAYWATKGKLDPPLKLGHDEDQALVQEDGYPAAGWVANLRRVGDRMYADLMNVPKRVAELIRAGAYKHLSIELNKDFSVDETKYPMMLTGLALLGADLPAVDSLGGIADLYQSLHLKLGAGAEALIYEVETEKGPVSKEIVTMADDIEIRQALGIGEDADPVAEIGNLRGRIGELEAAVATDGKATEKAEVAQLRKDLADAEKRYLSQENEWQKRIISLEEDNRREKAERMVEAAVAQGRVQPALREMALKLALRDPKDFEEFAAKLPGIDLTERGVATDADLAGLEPTATEMVATKQLGLSRVQIIRQKAADKGIDLPPDFEKAD
ncbi:hypothetical protein LCGC14_2188110, partial [marine sediment metagenome]